MKTLRISIASIFALLLMGCGNTQEPTAENTPDTRGTIREVADMDDRPNYDDNTTSSTSADQMAYNDNRGTNNPRNNTASKDNSSNSTQINYEASRPLADADIEIYWIELKKKDMSSMYDYLNMSKDQILKYQRGYVDYIGKMQDKHMRQTIDQRDLLKQRDDILRDILKPAQYDKYQIWVEQNPRYGL